MSDSQYRTEPRDPHASLTRELIATQIEVWLLEQRQTDVRSLLQHCRTRRAGLGRAYRRLIHTTTGSERA